MENKISLNTERQKRKKTISVPYKDTEEDKIVNGVKIQDFDFFKQKVKEGQFFLYEHIEYGKNSMEIQYPKLGILLNILPCDQTIELEIFDVRRTWEYRKKVEFEMTDGKKYTTLVAEFQSEMTNIILWNDTVNVYGVWDGRPDWKELKKAYQRTSWFGRPLDEKRDITIDMLLK